jgi:hypothetical protein
MSKHKHPKSKKAKSSAKKASASANDRPVNWHRIVWRLSPPDPADEAHQEFADDFYDAARSNEFWLEPELYLGPAATFGKGPALLRVDANTLCFRVRFHDDNMTAAWRNCVLFPRGSALARLGKDNRPIVAADTARLVGRTRVNRRLERMTVYMRARGKKAVTELRIFVGERGTGSHLGAGIAHQ